MKGIIQSVFLAVMLAGAVHAESVQIDPALTAEQKATLALEAAKMATANQTAGNNVPAPAAVDTVKKWADIGTAIGSGLASSAKQLGVAANDFAQTSVGKFTMLIIAWHFIGAPLVHIVFGSLWLLITVSFWVYFYRKATSSVTTTVYEAGKGPGGATKITVRAPRQFAEKDDDRTAIGAVYMVSLTVVLLIGIITVFSF